MANAIQIIKEDHREVEALFKKYKDLGDQAFAHKKELGAEICKLLISHARMEEKFLYPPAEQAFNTEGDKIVEEAYAEHTVAKQLIAEIESLSPEDAQYDAKITVLNESIAHHVKEEENELLPKVQKELSEETLSEIGGQMESFRASHD